METQEKVRKVSGFMCMFCGEIYDTEEEAMKCWDSHVYFVVEPIYTMGDEFPEEILVKKLEGEYYTQIATYTKVKKEEVRIPVEKGRVGSSENNKQ